jgi:transcription antitermination factor NusG
MHYLPWFAVTTEPKEEVYAQWHLERQGFRTFYPHEWIEVGTEKRQRWEKKPLFTGYLFVSGGTEKINFFALRETYGVRGVVYSPGGIAIPLPGKFMEELMDRADPTGCIHRPKGTRKSKRAMKGARVRDWVRLSETNPYWGLLVQVAKVDGDKATVLMNCLGRWVHTIITEDHIDEVIKNKACKGTQLSVGESLLTPCASA